MPGDPEEEDDYWFRPVWEAEDALEPPGTPRARKRAPEPDLHHPLLEPLARAQEAVARLETGVALASPAVAEGLRARLSYREAAGWLSYAHVWIHPHDLALRDQGLTSSYGVAFNAGRLDAAIPATAALESFESAPSDIMVNQALQLARLWRRLAELRTWRPLADIDRRCARPCNHWAVACFLTRKSRIGWPCRCRTGTNAYPCGASGARLDEPAGRDGPRFGRDFSRRLHLERREIAAARCPALLVGTGSPSSPARAADSACAGWRNFSIASPRRQ